MRKLVSVLIIGAVLSTLSQIGLAQATEKWVVSWAGSVQGPYPVGNPSAQPDMRFAFPSAEAGARDQTFRLIVRPDIWGRQVRLRLSNVFGTKPVTFDGIFVGLQLGSAALVAASNRPATFGGRSTVTIQAGQFAWSDAVTLPFFTKMGKQALAGRKLAVSFHIVGESGPMTWHAKALTTSYLTAPGAGAQGKREDEAAFPYTTASWYFLDAVEMMMPRDRSAVVAFGDSITDGTASTMNGDDRWPDVLSRRLHAVYGDRIAVVNAGIGGNQIAGPAEYGPSKPFPGGPAAYQRIDRDVLDLSGIKTVIWFEGINDFSRNGNASLETVQATVKETVARVRKLRPDIRIIGATVTSAFGSSSPAHGFIEQDEKRKALNTFIRSSGLFDGSHRFRPGDARLQSGGLTAKRRAPLE